LGGTRAIPPAWPTASEQRTGPRSRPCWRARSAAIIRSRTLAKVHHPHRRQRRRLRHASYLISRGFLDPARFELAIGAVVVFVWGGVLLGGLLPQEGISWQGHFLGAVGDSWRRGCSRPRESAPAIL
jgi:hypothetical protein